jgi:hypothetical protein
MTEHDLESAAKPLLLDAIPQVFVADPPASCDFFVVAAGTAIGRDAAVRDLEREHRTPFVAFG